MEEKELTTEEKRLKKIAQLKARLQKEESRLASDRRKERDGQLVAWGVYVEAFYKSADEAGRQRLEESVKKTLTGRNLERAFSGFSRLKEAKENHA